MKTLNLIFGATVLALATTAGSAGASSHREAPAIAQDPIADNTDTWAWIKKGSHDKLYVVAAYNPLEEPSGGPNFHQFSEDVLYEIHITGSGDSVADKWIYQIEFHTAPIPNVDVADKNKGPGGGKEFFAQLGLGGAWGQTYDVIRLDVTDPKNPKAKVIAMGVPVAPPRPGPRTQQVLKQFGLASSATYDQAYADTFTKPTSEGGRVWAGPRDDGFYVDLGGVFDLANLRAKGTAQNGVAGFNCHAIALEIPAATVTSDGMAPGNTPGLRSTVGVWASASRRQVGVLHKNGTTSWIGPWVQVSRLGLPLINEAVIGLQDKNRFNRSHPTTDVPNFGAYFLNPIIVRDAEAVGIYTALGVDPTPYKYGRTDILDVINLAPPALGNHKITLAGTGDVMRVEMATDSAFPNGRPLGAPYYAGANANKEDDVTDILLSLLLTGLSKPISDGVDYNDANYLADMPWLAMPWQGYDQGHGKPTP